jgi:putative peptidoglycan lipid II flippase
MAGFHDTVVRGLRQIGFMLIPASVIGAVLAEPVVRLLYERGEFTATNTTVVAGTFAAFCVGLTFNGTLLLLNRAFFSLQLASIAMVAALGNVALNVAFDAAFYRVGVWGIPLATSIVNVLGTLALILLLRNRIGRFELWEVGSTYLRILAAGAVAAGAAFGAWYGVDEAVGRSLLGQIVSLGVALSIGASTYLILARLLGIRELDALLSLIGRGSDPLE